MKLVCVAAVFLMSVGCGSSASQSACGTANLMNVNALAGALFPALVAQDLNGDGHVDLAVAGTGVTVLLGNGDGTFCGAADYDSDKDPSSIVAADFTGDGHADLATAFEEGQQYGTRVHVLRGNGDGSFASASTSEGLPGLLPLLAAGDFDRNGRADLAMARPYLNDVGVLLGNGDSSFQAPVAYLALPPGGDLVLRGADFNGDDEMDLALLQVSHDIVVLLGRGDGTFPTQPGATELIDAVPVLGVGDFNGDGKLDAAVGLDVDASGGTVCQVGVRLGNGDGTFQTGADILTDLAGCNSLSAGDFDGDGRLDLAVVANKVTLLFGNGDGTFGRPASYAGIVAFGQNSVGVGDFDADGRDDLAVGTSSELVVILGRTVP